MQDQAKGRDTSAKLIWANVPEDVATEEEVAVDPAIDRAIAQDEPVAAAAMIARTCKHAMVRRSIMMWMLPRSLGTSLPRRWDSLAGMAGNTFIRIVRNDLEAEAAVEAETYKKSMLTHRVMALLAPSLVALRLRPEAAEDAGDAVELALDEAHTNLGIVVDYYLAPYWFLWDY